MEEVRKREEREIREERKRGKMEKAE